MLKGIFRSIDRRVRHSRIREHFAGTGHPNWLQCARFLPLTLDLVRKQVVWGEQWAWASEAETIKRSRGVQPPESIQDEHYFLSACNYARCKNSSGSLSAIWPYVAYRHEWVRPVFIEQGGQFYRSWPAPFGDWRTQLGWLTFGNPERYWIRQSAADYSVPRYSTYIRVYAWGYLQHNESWGSSPPFPAGGKDEDLGRYSFPKVHPKL